MRPIDSRDRVSSMKCLVSSSIGDVWFFDDQDRGIVQVGSRERDPELLVGLEVMAERADRRVVAVGKVLDEVVGVGQLGRFDDRAAGYSSGRPDRYSPGPSR